MSAPKIHMRVHRAPAIAIWEHEHRWGTLISDTTTLQVKRVSGGALTIGYGRESVEIRKELVEMLASMIAEAASWGDDQ